MRAPRRRVSLPSSTGPLARAMAIALLILPLPALAHESLYQVVEIRETDSGNPEILVNVHAAELATDLGIDPLRADLDWISLLPAGDRRLVLSRADRFVSDSFDFGPEAERQEFAKQLAKAQPSTDDSARPGCLATVVRLPAGPEPIRFRYRGDEKRLLVVLNRPGRFPEVHDFAPGALVELSY